MGDGFNTSTLAFTTETADFLETSTDKGGEGDLNMVADVQFVMNAIVGPVACFIGMVGNILSVITWSRPGMASSTGRYLTGQALADLGVLLMFILRNSVQAWAPAVSYSYAYGWFFCYIAHPFFFLAVVCSIWITVGVTVDRYIMVCWISKSKKFCSTKRANFGLFLIVVNAVFINLPHFAFYTPVYPEDKSNDSTSTNSAPKAYTLSDFGRDSGGQFYKFWIHCIMMLLVPWVSVLCMNIMIIRRIIKSNKRMAGKMTRGSMLRSKESENQITRLILVVTFSYLFFFGLLCVVQCLANQHVPGVNKVLVQSFYVFAKTGMVFNSSLNFVLYCLTGRRFRSELMRVLGFARKDIHLSSFSDQSSSGSSGASSTDTGGIGSMGSLGLLSRSNKLSL